MNTAFSSTSQDVPEDAYVESMHMNDPNGNSSSALRMWWVVYLVDEPGISNAIKTCEVWAYDADAASKTVKHVVFRNRSLSVDIIGVISEPDF
jgi:hypothetical protein